MLIRHTLTALTAAAVLALAACSDDGGGDQGRDRTEAGLRAAVEDMADAAKKDDVRAYTKFFSDQCRDASDLTKIR
jgi:hypothetical protein